MTGPATANLADSTQSRAGSVEVAREIAGSDDHPLIEVENLVVGFGSVSVLNGIYLRVGRRNSLGILGPSGSGKTTLLNALAGFISLRSGSVRLNAAPTSGRPIKTMAFQDHGLFPYMTVFKNIAFGLESHGVSETAIMARVNYLSGLFEITPLLNHKASTLSGGEKQRVGLARALAPNPQIMLLDEPFSQLDRPLREMVRQRVSRLIRHEKITVVMVSHDYEDIFTLADNVAVLDLGQIVQQDKPIVVYSEPRTITAARLTGRLVSFHARCESGCLVFGNGAYVQRVYSPRLLSHNTSAPDWVVIAYRPECATTTHKPTDDCESLAFRGRLIAMSQHTHSLECVVEIGAGNEVLMGLCQGDCNTLKIGDDVYIAVRLSSLFAFNPSTGERII